MAGKINMKKEAERSLLKKTWNFLWNSDSFLSWIIDLALIYLFVKFIFFPLLTLIFATPLPSVIVQTSSMTHNNLDFNSWWQDFGEWYLKNSIVWEDAEKWHYSNGLDKGDIVILKGERDKDYDLEVGDIIVFDAHPNQAIPIIHRVVVINPDGSVGTKGDNNMDQHSWEKNLPASKILGKAIFRIPKLGWIKLGIVELFQ